jgi:hypothetical protein
VKYAVLVKHFARDISDVRIEIIEVPRELENFGPHEAELLVREKLLGPFEVIAVTDRISTTVINTEDKP